MELTITNLTVVYEFKNNGMEYGVYSCSVNGKPRVFTYNGKDMKAISHHIDGDSLDRIRYDVQEKILKLIQENKEISKQ